VVTKICMAYFVVNWPTLWRLLYSVLTIPFILRFVNVDKSHVILCMIILIHKMFFINIDKPHVTLCMIVLILRTASLYWIPY